jgi:hypothetical protein
VVTAIPLTQFTSALTTLFEETFERGQGIYLDPGTSLFETLADITAAEASRPVSRRCASIAGQVGHVCFYLELAMRYVHGEVIGPVDWAASWATREVSEAEWTALLDRLRAAHAAILTIANDPATWAAPTAVGGALGTLAHSAYHLGEIRQALCTLRA